MALILLEMESFVPDIVREEILYSTTWEYDKRWWGPDLSKLRKEFLKKLRETIKNQEPGKKYEF